MRAGYLPSCVSTDHAPFTFNEGATTSLISSLLSLQNFDEANIGILGEPSYHFEVVVMTSRKKATFAFSLEQLERVSVISISSLLYLQFFRLGIIC